MSFQSYIANIEAKTGKTPDEFRSVADAKGFMAGAIIAWLKEDFDLGHGHAMAIYALLKGLNSAST